MSTDKLPDGLTRVKFGQVASRVNESVRPTPDQSKLYIGLEHMRADSHQITEWGSAVDLDVAKTPVLKGDVLFARRNTHLRRCAVAPFDTIFSPDGYAIRTKDPMVLIQEFLLYVVASDGFMDFAVENSAGTHSKRVKWSALAQYEFALPPIDEQRRIVQLMNAVERVVGGLVAAEAEAQNLYDSLQVGLRRWTAKRTSLSALVSMARAGGTPSRAAAENFGGDIPWLKSGEVLEDGITTTEETITPLGLASSSAWLVPAGSPVIAMYGATAGEVGYTAVPLTTNQAVLAVAANDTICGNRYLYHLLKGSSVELKALAVGAAQPNLSKDRIMKFEVPDCSIDEQNAWIAKVESVGGLLRSLRQRIAQMSEVRVAIREELLEIIDVH